jgi:hypothetical protein
MLLLIRPNNPIVAFETEFARLRPTMLAVRESLGYHPAQHISGKE